jgi:hypothetical protein
LRNTLQPRAVDKGRLSSKAETGTWGRMAPWASEIASNKVFMGVI